MMSDMEYIETVLVPEFIERFRQWNGEYPEERPLGARAEWHGIHRKVGKLKRPIWDGEVVPMREDPRTMFLEIAGHAFLAIASLDQLAAISLRYPGLQTTIARPQEKAVDFLHESASGNVATQGNIEEADRTDDTPGVTDVNGSTA